LHIGTHHPHAHLDAFLDAKTKTVRLIVVEIRILADDDHSHVLQRREVQRSEDLRAHWEHSLGLVTFFDKLLQLLPVRLCEFGCKRLSPYAI
jgi:hypothetical protein